MNNRLYRSRNDRLLGGVCGGLGTFLAIDSTIIRLIVAASVIFLGVTPLIYVLLWIIIPLEPEQPPTLIETSTTSASQSPPQLAALPSVQDPTGEWQYDPYTGQPIRREQQS